MPKQLITIIGLIVSLGIVALGVALVALPMLLDSLSVDSQTAAVASTNDLYQTQVDQLTEEQARQSEIDSSVGALRNQIPATAQLDDVFEVAGNAAAASGVTIKSVTAGVTVPFLARTEATDSTETLPVEETPTPESTNATETDPTSDAEVPTGADAPADDTETSSGDLAPTGRQQVDFSIQIIGADMAQVVAFLDALRAGPRLFSTITTLSSSSGDGVQVQVDGLTFMDLEG